MNRRRVLVIGSTGMVGHVVYMYLKQQGHVVFGVSNEDVPLLVDKVIDARNIDELFAYIFAEKIDSIINCVGLLNQECDKNPKLARYLNSEFPQLLGKFCSANSIYLISISTDYVFSGSKESYKEDDIPDCISGNLYSLTKRDGEIIGLNHCATIRTSFIGPDYSPSNKGLFNWIILTKNNVTGFKHVYWNGVTTLEFAKQINLLLQKEKYGVFHMVSENNYISKYDLLNLMNNLRKKPINVGCSTERHFGVKLADSKNMFNISSINNMLEEIVCWIKSNDKLYSSLREELK